MSGERKVCSLPLGANRITSPPLPLGEGRGEGEPPIGNAIGARPAFTLFELILAIALSATLLGLIGTAINLYLLRVDAGRTRVEEAQLARAILAMIADDIRATAIYKPQDTSAIAQLMTHSISSDGDTTEESSAGSAGSAGTAGSASGTESSSDSSGGGSSSGFSTATGGNQQPDSDMPLGLNGSLGEIYIDAARFPRRDELFSTYTGYTNAPMAAMPDATAAVASAAVMLPSDLKTVRYFLRQGPQVGAGSAATIPLSPAEQLQAGGLARQEIPRRARIFSEQTGNSGLLDSGQVLIAPEVVHLEFRYYDGEQLLDIWDMQEETSLPLAVEVRIWLATNDANSDEVNRRYDAASIIASARQYRQWVYLPMALANEDSHGISSDDDSSSNSDSGGVGNQQP